MLPDEIFTKDYSNATLSEFIHSKVKNEAHSSIYNSIHKGNRYPLNLIINRADKYANSYQLYRTRF